MAGELSPLSTPKPDLAIGLLVADEDIARDSTSSHMAEVGVRDVDLLNLQIKYHIHPWPSNGTPDLAYPAIVYECKSDTSPIYYAENQAAVAAAKALRMLSELATAGQESDADLPVIVLCSSGFSWRIFVAFEDVTFPNRQTVSEWLRNVRLISHLLTDFLCCSTLFASGLEKSWSARI